MSLAGAELFRVTLSTLKQLSKLTCLNTFHMALQAGTFLPSINTELGRKYMAQVGCYISNRKIAQGALKEIQGKDNC